jgi:hypothetical protein
MIKTVANDSLQTFEEWRPASENNSVYIRHPQHLKFRNPCPHMTYIPDNILVIENTNLKLTTKQSLNKYYIDNTPTLDDVVKEILLGEDNYFSTPSSSSPLLLASSTSSSSLPSAPFAPSPLQKEVSVSSR